MIIVGSNYWNISIGRNSGDVIEDKEGLVTLNKLSFLVKFIKTKLSA